MSIRNKYDENSDLLPGGVQKNVLVNRYNELAGISDESRKLIRLQSSKISNLRKDIVRDIDFLRNELNSVNGLLDAAIGFQKETSSDFKFLVKKDSFDRLSNKIDRLDFENLISRREFDRLRE